MMFGLTGVLAQQQVIDLINPRYCPQNTTGFFDIYQSQSGTWTPTQLTPTLWLDATDSSTVIHSNNEVFQWNDKSGNGYHVSQATQANRPLTNQSVLSEFNLRNYIAFDTTAKRLLNVSWNFTLTSQHTFIVFSQSTAGRMFSQSNSGVDTGTGMYVPAHTSSATTIGSLLGSTTLRSSVAMVTANTKVNLFESRHDGSILYNSVNAGTEVSFSQSLNTTVTRMGINASLTATNGVGNGGVRNIGEIIIFNNTTLSTSDRERIEGYLAWKWGLVNDLPSSHPYKSSPPNI